MLTSIASIVESATSNEWTGTPDSPDLIRPTRSVVSPVENQLHHVAPISSNLRAIELHSDHSDDPNNTAQPRPSAPPVMVYPPPPPPPISFAEMNVPPPPPIFTPGGPHSSLDPGAPRSAISAKLDDEQQSLRDLRDKLVGARFSLAAKRQEFRDLHIETSAKDGHVFNLLRQYLNEIGANLPQDIEDALVAASSLRDRHGLLEAEYDEAEASFNTLEWKYSRREARFVEEVLNNKLVPCEALDRSRSADNLEILQLTTHSMTDDTNIDSIIADLTAPVDEMSDSHGTHMSEFLSEQALMSTHNANAKFRRSRSRWSNRSDLTMPDTKKIEEYHQTHSHLRWVEKMNDIDEWLLEMVDVSPLLKLCLKAIHDFGFTDTGTWWDHTKWLLIQDYSKHFHTGDSTVSINHQDQHISTSTRKGLSSTPSGRERHSPDAMMLGLQPSSISDTALVISIIESGDSHDTKDEVRIPLELPADATKKASSSPYTSQSPKPRASQKSTAPDKDGGTRHYSYYARSMSFTEGVGAKPTSYNIIPIRQSGVFHTTPTLPLLRRHTIPDLKDIEPVPVMISATDPGTPLMWSCTFPPPVFDPNSPNAYRRRLSHTGSPSRQRSESERPPPSKNPHLVSPQAHQPSLVDKCLVM